MNKTIFFLILYALDLIAVRAESPGGEFRNGSPLTVDTIKHISVMIAGKWDIIIYAEGPSRLDYGALPNDGALIPEGKVSLTKIYGQIKDRLAAEPEELKSRNIVLVNFRVKNGSPLGENVSKWMEASEAYKIFDEMVANGKPYDQERFEMLLNKYPANPDRKLVYHYNEDGTLQVTPDPRAEVEVPEESERPREVKDRKSFEGEPRSHPSGQGAKRQTTTENAEHSKAWRWTAVVGAILVVTSILLALIKAVYRKFQGKM